MYEELMRKTRKCEKYTDDEILESKNNPEMREIILTGLYNFINKLCLVKIAETNLHKEDLIGEAQCIMLNAYNNWTKDARYEGNKYSFYTFMLGSIYNRLPDIKHTRYGFIIAKPHLTKAFIRQTLAKYNVEIKEGDDLYQLWNEHIYRINSFCSISDPISNSTVNAEERFCYEDIIPDTSDTYDHDRYYTRSELKFLIKDIVLSYRDKMDDICFNVIMDIVNYKYQSITDAARDLYKDDKNQIRNFTNKIKRILARIQNDPRSKDL